MKTGALAVFLLLYVVAAIAADEFPDTLTLDKAAVLAVRYHPSMRVADATLASSNAVVTQAYSSYYPVIAASAGDTRTGGTSILSPTIPARTLWYDSYAVAFTLQQTVFDFGRTISRVSVNSNLSDASAYDVQSTRNTVVMNAQLAFLALVAAERIVTVNEQSVAQAQEHLDQSKAFFSVGRRPQYDVTSAELVLANAKVNLIKAKNQERVARLQLESAIGLHPRKQYAVAVLPASEKNLMPLDSAKANTIAYRPELQAAKMRIASSDAQVSAAWTQHMPSIVASGAYNWNGYAFPLLSKWNVGLMLSLPIFQGFNVSAQVEQARANADATRASTDVLMESVMLEVEQNYLAVNEAAERIAASSKLEDQARENLDLAEGRYTSGVGSPIEITDAQVTLANAQITRIQADYDYQSSLIRLRRAMGL